MDLRIALVQYDPILRQRERNVRTVDAMLADLRPGDVDILLLPEMAFTGYMFIGDEVDPFLEDDAGPSISWAKATATRLKSYVMFGFPERCRETGQRFNSLAIVSWNGQLEMVYRKHFLYDTDKTWAAAGSAFTTFAFTLPHGRGGIIASPSICMDLNPQDFVAPFDKFEYASFCASNNVKLVLCSMNWLASEPPNFRSDGSHEDWSDVSDTLSYWATRMTPLIGKDAIFLACNRIGTERETTFTGSSCVMRLADRPAVLAYAGKAETRIVRTTIQIS